MDLAVSAPIACPGLAAAETPRAGWLEPAFIADWRRFIFLHFAFAPEDLQPHIPYPLDLYDGRAYVSLVFFHLERMRPGRLIPAALGRALLRPLSDHPFVNVRTYVRPRAAPGIQFLAEWITNPLSQWLGPLTYGLPYRMADIRSGPQPEGGMTRVAVRVKGIDAALDVAVPRTQDAPLRQCETGSVEEFLFERYLAYTYQRGLRRYFRVGHSPWEIARADGARFDPSLVEKTFPWFQRAQFAGAHLSPGISEVQMGWPHRI